MLYRLPDPFDRHDWIVRRPRTGATVRYVIDYYGIKHPHTETELVIDARPALETFDNARMRGIALVGRAFDDLAVRSRSDSWRRAVKYGTYLVVVVVSLYTCKFVVSI